MLPTTRTEFRDYCLRNLGHPVIEVNVDFNQLEDRIDEALQYYWDYHFDGTDVIYYKYQITEGNRPDRVFLINVTDGGIGYSNNDTVVLSGGYGVNAAASIVTDNSGTIIGANISDHGESYRSAPAVSITTSTGSGAILTAELGGFIPVPENIIGVVRMFDLSTVYNSSNFFSVDYQIALNDLWHFSSFSMVPYYMTRQHLELVRQILIGQQPIRYNRHKNKLYVDMNWNRIKNDEYLIFEAYQVVDPNEYSNVWKDRWLLNYTTALFKRQWGNHLKKYNNMTLANGITMNGQQIYDEAIQEIKELESEMINSYSLPVMDFFG